MYGFENRISNIIVDRVALMIFDDEGLLKDNSGTSKLLVDLDVTSLTIGSATTPREW